MNEQEDYEFNRLKTLQSALGGTIAIVLPITVIYAFSSKYNMGSFYGKFINSTLLLGGFGFGSYYVNNKQRTYLKQLSGKYFGAQMSDEEMK